MQVTQVAPKLVLISLATAIAALGLACVEEPDPEPARRPGLRKQPLPEIVASDYEPFVPLPRDTKRERLFERLYSFMSAEEAKAAMPELGLVLQDDRTVPTGGLCPGIRTTRYAASEYTHFESEGEVTLEFENDRLTSVAFNPSPTQANRYLARLRRAGLLKGPRKGLPDPERPNLRIWALAVTGLGGVSFEDDRLSTELLAASGRCRKQRRYDEAGIPIPPAPAS